MSRKPSPQRADNLVSERGPMRLQRILATAGHGSRRECEELITSGRVEVDRQIVSHLGAKADPLTQEIRVDGQRLENTQPTYYLVNKPVGVVTTNRDPAGRPRVIDLVPDRNRVFPVGRLDLSSEGLIIVTNDGDLANQLTHPRYGVEKTYEVEIAGRIEPKQFAKMKSGVHLAEGFARVVSVQVKKQRPHSTVLEMILAEGKNREVRRILARVGHKVLRLKRTAIGPIRLEDLPVGSYRPLSRQEIQALREDASPRAHKARQKQRKESAPPPRRQPAPTRSAEPAAEPEAESGPVIDLPVRLGKDRSARSRRVLGESAPPVPARKKPAPRPSQPTGKKRPFAREKSQTTRRPKKKPVRPPRRDR